MYDGFPNRQAFLQRREKTRRPGITNSTCPALLFSCAIAKTARKYRGGRPALGCWSNQFRSPGDAAGRVLIGLWVLRGRSTFLMRVKKFRPLIGCPEPAHALHPAQMIFSGGIFFLKGVKIFPLPCRPRAAARRLHRKTRGHPYVDFARLRRLQRARIVSILSKFIERSECVSG